MAEANRALAARAAADGQRLVLSVTWRGHPRAFLASLRLGRALASLTGDVAVDVETRPAALRSREGAAESAAARRRRCRRAAAARGAAPPPPAAPRDGSSSEGEGAEAPFEPVLPVRRATLQQFYHLVRPVLAQLASDADAAPRAAAAAGAGGGDGAAAPEGSAQEDATCAICYDAPVDTVSPCAHAFCADCYARWRATAHGCALCRAPLPPERGGGGAWVLAEAEPPAEGEAEVAAPARTPAARLAAWVAALPLAA